MKIILLSKVISITYIPRSGNFSSIKAENFSSLDRLAYYIGVAYKKLPYFQELTAPKVIEILKSIMDGTYTLSPLHLHAYPKNGDQKHSGYFQKLLVKDEPNVYYVVNPTLYNISISIVFPPYFCSIQWNLSLCDCPLSCL
jgi:hypothetical protein